MERDLCHAVGFGPGFLARMPLLSTSSGPSEPASVSYFTRPRPASWVTPYTSLLGLVHPCLHDRNFGCLARLFKSVYIPFVTQFSCVNPDNVI